MPSPAVDETRRALGVRGGPVIVISGQAITAVGLVLGRALGQLRHTTDEWVVEMMTKEVAACHSEREARYIAVGDELLLSTAGAGENSAGM